MSAIDEIKARLDIIDVVGQYVHLKKAGRNYKGLCPFHNEKTPSFTVFADTQSWRCFGQCNEGGDIFSFVMKREGWDFREALQELAQRAGVQLEVQQRDPSQEARENRLHDLLTITAEFFTDALPDSPAEAYVQQRGINPATAQHFGIGYAPDSWQDALNHLKMLGFREDEIVETGVAIRNEQGRVYDRFRHRLMIPIRDERGRTIGFGARALEADQQPKYLNSPQSELFDKSRTLYGLSEARRAIRETETAVLMEGYMDVIQAHQQGYPNAVAQMGTALTDEHLRLLSKYANKLILAFDTDAAGIKATMRGLETAREALGGEDLYVRDAGGMLRQAGRLNLDIRVLELPQGKDPDEFLRNAPTEWQAQLDAALPLAEYVIKIGTADLPANASVAEREKLAYELLPLLVSMEDDVQRLDHVQMLIQRLRLDPKGMMEQVAKLLHRPMARTQTSQNPFRKKQERPPTPPAPPPRYSLATRKREAERLCLSMLIQQPQRLSEGNRRLRELVGTLSTDIAAPLSISDFSQSDFKAIFALLEQACQQDVLGSVDYLYQYIAEELRDSLEQVLAEQLDLFARRADRRSVTDLQGWQRENAQAATVQRRRDEFWQLFLKLRLERLRQEAHEVFFLLTEAQESNSEADSQHYQERFNELGKIIRILDTEINRDAVQAKQLKTMY